MERHTGVVDDNELFEAKEDVGGHDVGEDAGDMTADVGDDDSLCQKSGYGQVLKPARKVYQKMGAHRRQLGRET